MSKNNLNRKNLKVLYTGQGSTWEKTPFWSTGGEIIITNKEFIFNSNKFNFNNISINIPLNKVEYAYKLPFPPIGAFSIKIDSENEEYKFGSLDRDKVLAILNKEEDSKQRSHKSKESRNYTQKYNMTAIVAFILSFFIPVIPIILGISALNEIKESGERGDIYAHLAIWLSILEMVAIFIILNQ